MTEPLPRPRLRWADDRLWSDDADDHYHGPAADHQAEQAFLGLNRLPERFASLRGSFHLAELGFGTGFNFAKACQLFLATAPSDSRLLYTAFEQAPPDHGQLAGIAGQRPHLTAIDQALLQAWPVRLPGWHRRSLFAGRIQLCLYWGDAAAGLASLPARVQAVDAWFLDGFAPDRNPSLWQPKLFHQLARRSRQGSTVATWSSAGAVRRGLQAAGFTMRRASGAPVKLHWLAGTASSQGSACQTPVTPRVLVAGAGLAGACVARQLADNGAQVQVLDAGPAHQQATGAGSSNPAAALHARLPRQSGPLLHWRLAALAHASHWLHGHAGYQPGAMLQHAGAVPPAQLAQGLALATPLGPWVQAAEPDRTGFGRRWLADSAGPGLLWPLAGWADLSQLCPALLDHPRISLLPPARATALSRTTAGGLRLQTTAGEHWIGADADTGTDAQADHLVLALGTGSLALLPGLLRATGALAGTVNRLRLAPGTAGLAGGVSGHGYALPAPDLGSSASVWAGATFERTPLSDASAARRNRARLRLLTGLRSAPEPAASWRGSRCTSPDRLPIAGPVPGFSGLWLLTALGASGLLQVPLAGAALAAALLQQPPALPAATAALLDPARKAMRPRSGA